jgi:hypothetical protein
VKYPQITENQEIIAILGAAGTLALFLGQMNFAFFLFGGMLAIVNPASPKGPPPAPLG